MPADEVSDFPDLTKCIHLLSSPYFNKKKSPKKFCIPWAVCGCSSYAQQLQTVSCFPNPFLMALVSYTIRIRSDSNPLLPDNCFVHSITCIILISSHLVLSKLFPNTQTPTYLPPTHPVTHSSTHLSIYLSPYPSINLIYPSINRKLQASKKQRDQLIIHPPLQKITLLQIAPIYPSPSRLPAHPIPHAYTSTSAFCESTTVFLLVSVSMCRRLKRLGLWL
jgi:hypothetical protein